ncbi:MAG: ribosome maturation factor RimM [Acidiferrobacterales bacterium]
MADSKRPDETVVVGKITGVYGIKGWVKVYSYTRPITGILEYKTWQLSPADESAKPVKTGPAKTGQTQTLQLVAGRQQGKGIVAQLSGYDDRDQVRVLIDQEISVPRSQLPTLPAGEYYWTDLEGLTVVGSEGAILGQVDHIMETGANDVIVVNVAGTKGAKKAKQCLIPYIPEVVQKIDLDQGMMQVDWQLDWDAD